MKHRELKGTKTRNGVGLVKVKSCYCGVRYQVRRGRNYKGLSTVFDPKQCGQHRILA